jgi:hypothetical protein
MRQLVRNALDEGVNVKGRRRKGARINGRANTQDQE